MTPLLAGHAALLAFVGHQKVGQPIVLGLVQGSVYGLIALGLVLLYKSNRIFNFAQAEFGIFLGGPDEWGKGYGQEATRLVVGWGFEALALNRIWLHVHADNERGIHAYEKVGFRTEGLLRQPAWREGRFVDVVSMAVLREEWSARP